MNRTFLTTHLLILFSLVIGIPSAFAGDVVSFQEDVRPLLSDRCFACHGPDEHSREAGLRLDQPDGPDGAVGYAIEPGSVDESELWNRVTTDDEDIQMPPPDSHLQPLSPSEQELIRRWIEAGAPYEDFWAFQKPTRPAVPRVKSNQWTGQPIDQFVLQRLEVNQRQPSPPADPRTLIRRLTFDLTGLPPTRQEIRRFLEDYGQAPGLAWEEAVDRLIGTPQYGEHMGRYWLDLVRFADTNGMHKDFYRHHAPYRDWVIDAFNHNFPYDDFVRYQIAGDLFEDPTNDQLVASGFNRLHLIIDRGTALPEESEFKNTLDRVTAVGTAFMGLTVQCAQCHDHKFDPITQKDFYSLFAFFDNIDAAPETNGREPGGIQAPFVRLMSPEQEVQWNQLSDQIAHLEAKLGSADDEAAAVLKQQIETVQTERDQLDKTIDKAMVMKEREEIKTTYVRQRGQYDAFGEAVERNTPGFLPPLKRQGDLASRWDLAQWLVDPENPLTARVAVNRIWQQFFGVGLVKTSEDFGSQGEVPSHPKLLDYLAVSFTESGWDVKALVKQIVMSQTYRQSSEAPQSEFQQDPDNRLLSRGSRYRMDAEMIRDQILATSGLLSRKMYGRSVKPPQPPGLWKAVSMIGEVYRPDQGDSIYRRSIYTFWKRGMPPPQMTILNAPVRDACTARRERTNTPLQALLMLNESQYLKAASHLAMKTLQQPDDQRIDFAWETVTSKLPDPQETKVMQVLLGDLMTKYQDQPGLADKICEGLDLSDGVSKQDVAAWTVVVNTLYNLDQTKTKE